ncbi:MAG: D-serine ammonia-lyase [Clostridia bacterium]|nr:D-serine ammonia-lyase [Clostridia bacterium]
MKSFNEIPHGASGLWINPYKKPSAQAEYKISDAQIKDAQDRLLRFAPYIAKKFSETAANGGLIESELKEISRMGEEIYRSRGEKSPGRLFLKADSHLPIAGSVKARGGIYEVLRHAEDLAVQNGLLSYGDDYSILAGEKFTKFFSDYTVQVGSTGNLGLSIGIMSAALGFKVIIHMSADAKQWKKDLLRSRGAEVIEYPSDYTQAVKNGRLNSQKDPNSYFVDDEKSVDLFLGYATAGKRLKAQLEKQNITVDRAHPLMVYIPAGVGGAPGGISYSLKRIYGDNVHCFFAEPAECPSVLLGIATQQHENADVREYGFSGKTKADGLACPRPSGLVTGIMTQQLSGIFTVTDSELSAYMKMLNGTEGIRVEPSACAGFAGCSLLSFENGREYCEKHGLDENALSNSVHIVWATGGSMVPPGEYE